MSVEFRVVVLISGRGSNLEQLILKAVDYKVVGIVSNKAEAGGLRYAKVHDIPAFVIERSQFESLSDQKRAILQKVLELKPDLVALAGFMQIIDPEFIDALSGRVINIHPSLLPKFPGLNTHSRALQASESRHGCTVHFVDKGIDTGKIIAQAEVAVLEDDTEETLAARVLEQEHQLYPKIVNQLARGEICLSK